MTLPSYIVSMCLVFSGFRNLPRLYPEIQRIIINFFDKSLDKPIISAYCDFVINSTNRAHHIFINFEQDEYGNSYKITRKLKEPEYSPVIWFKDGHKSTYFSFDSNKEFELFLNALWECGISKNKLKPIHFNKDVLKSDIL